MHWKSLIPRPCEHLLTQVLGQELLVFDPERQQAHSLSGLAAQVWNACDGQSSLNQIAQELELRPEEVLDAVQSLHQLELIEMDRPELLQRREVLTTLAAVAVAAPLISSILLPEPAQAASGVCATPACLTCKNLAGGQTCVAACVNCPGDCWFGNTSCTGLPNLTNITCNACDTQLIPQGTFGCTRAGGCTCQSGGGFNNCSWIAV